MGENATPTITTYAREKSQKEYSSAVIPLQPPIINKGHYTYGRHSPYIRLGITDRDARKTTTGHIHGHISFSPTEKNQRRSYTMKYASHGHIYGLLLAEAHEGPSTLG